MDWDVYRRPNGTIELVRAWANQGVMAGVRSSKACQFLRDIEELQPINSRQAAAIAIATANSIARRHDEE